MSIADAPENHTASPSPEEQVLLDELRSLSLRRQRLVNQVKELEGEITFASRDIERMENILKRVRAVRGTSVEKTEAVVAGVGDQAVAPARTGTVDVVYAFVASRPGGTTSEEVARALEGEISSESSNKRRVIQNTLINLRNRGLLSKLDNKYFANPPAQAN